tara:strand:+ start:2431 stop:3768 length:1338 start_codon:yes stop_codon:yes gene_type:complete
MINNGANIFRLNMSHGSRDSKIELYDLLKGFKLKDGERPTILTDLCGPKVRINSKFKTLDISKDETVILSSKDSLDGEILITENISLSNIDLKSEILINDGKIKLLVQKKISKFKLECKVLISGKVEPSKGVNFPNSTLDLPSLTIQDVEDLELALEKGADLIALSFVRNHKDINEIKRIMKKNNSFLPVIAKIEKWEALDDIDNIISNFDGVMVARGDLGVEIPSAKVPIAQKKIAKLANKHGKPVIIATQMLESMITNQVPTRAEVSDIANSIFDSVDALMVTGETAIGNYPIEVVKTLKDVIRLTEKSLVQEKVFNPDEINKTGDAISHAVCQITKDLNINIIMTMTHSGGTARMISKYRPPSNVIALTPFNSIIRQLRLIWGITPIKVDKYDDIDLIPDLCKRVIYTNKLLGKGEKFIITGGVPMGVSGTTNYLSVQTNDN